MTANGCPFSSGSRRIWLSIGLGRWGAAEVTLAGPPAAFVALAVPDERGWRGVPAHDGVVEPGDQVVLGLRLMPVERPTDEDPLDGLGHIQPGAAERGVQRQDPVPEQP